MRPRRLQFYRVRHFPPMTAHHIFRRCLKSEMYSLRRFVMISAAIAFFIIALIAALFGFSSNAGAGVNLAWILSIVGIVLAVIFGVLGRRPPVLGSVFL